MPSCILNPASEEVADFIYRFGSLQNNLRDPEQFPCVDYVSSDYAIFYMPLSEALPLSLERYPYYSIPGLFTLLDDSAMEASGILAALQTPALSNMGKGVLIGIVDTGIDYTSPVFRNEDGTTRILGLWDQTLPEDTSAPSPGVPDYYPMGGASYGTEFTMEEINAALAADDPFSLVPSRDINGHGTFLAGLAAGRSFPLQNFTGAAPMADLAVVKLKPAKKYLRDYYLIPENAAAFQENDIMLGIKYLRVIADRFRQPLVILLGLGSNYGSHTGTSPLSQVTQNYGGFFGIATVIAAGNETGLSHHYAGQLSADTPYEDVELRVGEREAERGFILELWSSATELFTVGFVSPGGERINRIPILANNETRIPFLLENTILTVNYELIEAGSGSQLVSVRFERPSAGIWTIRVYNTQFLTGEYHMWLPVQGFISEETVFLKPDPSNTITVPGNSRLPITVGAYDHRNNSIYIHSSRGYTSRDYVKPDLAAPGVDVLGPGIRDTSGAGVRSFLYSGNNIPSITPSQNTPSNTSAPSSIQENLQTFSRRTGTSAAAAITAGAVANLLSWGIVMGNYPAMSEAPIKSYLIRGAARNPALSYPNREFGYGTLDLLQTFLRLRE